MGFGDAGAKDKKAAKSAAAGAAAAAAAEDAAWEDAAAGRAAGCPRRAPGRPRDGAARGAGPREGPRGPRRVGLERPPASCWTGAGGRLASAQDGDKGLKSKAARAAAKDEKADAKLAAKAEKAALEAAENEEISKLSGANKKAPAAKVTQAEIARRQALLAMAKPKAASKTKTVAQPKLEENTNRKGEIEASGVDAALSALDGGGAASKPAKMTYAEFERINIDGIKEDNPGLKMSQLKERCFKLWERAPENPKNQEK